MSRTTGPSVKPWREKLALRGSLRQRQGLDMLGILLQLTAVDLPDQSSQRRVGRCWYPDFGTLVRDQAIGEIDFGAPATRYVAPDR